MKKKMETYIKPYITVNRVDFENAILNVSVIIVDDDNPSKKEALSKGLNIFMEEEQEEKKGIWDE